MQFEIPDYLFGGLTIVLIVVGLFRGFSGMLAFLIASAAAAAIGAWGWAFSATVEALDAVWMRGLATLVVTLLGFGIVRVVVKRCVNGLLAQPTDAILGALCGALVGGLILVGWTYSGFYTEHSTLAKAVAPYLPDSIIQQD